MKVAVRVAGALTRVTLIAAFSLATVYLVFDGFLHQDLEELIVATMTGFGAYVCINPDSVLGK